MSRIKKYYEYDLPRSVVSVTVALCSDYERRAKAIRTCRVDGDVQKCYVQLNEIIDRALLDIEIGLRAQMLADISHGFGYGRSAAKGVIDKNAYYRRRRKLIYDVAKGLSLV